MRRNHFPLRAGLASLLALSGLACTPYTVRPYEPYVPRYPSVHVLGVRIGGELRVYRSGTPEAAELLAATKADYLKYRESVVRPKEPYWVSEDGDYHDVEDAMEIASLKEQAAIDFQCDPSKVTVLRFMRNGAALADGCGHRDVYIWRRTSRDTSSAPGFDELEVTLTTGGFFSVQIPDCIGIAALRRLAPPGREDMDACAVSGDPDVMVDRSNLAQVNEQASRNLHCPRNQVFPGWIPHHRKRMPDAFAEGCGRRAYYHGRGGHVGSAMQVEACDTPACVRTSSSARISPPRRCCARRPSARVVREAPVAAVADAHEYATGGATNSSRSSYRTRTETRCVSGRSVQAPTGGWHVSKELFWTKDRDGSEHDPYSGEEGRVSVGGW